MRAFTLFPEIPWRVTNVIEAAPKLSRGLHCSSSFAIRPYFKSLLFQAPVFQLLRNKNKIIKELAAQRDCSTL